MSTDMTQYELTDIKLALAIIAFLVSFGIGLLVLFYLRKYLILRQHPFISKRYPILVATSVAGVLVFILVERVLSSIIHCGIYSAIWFQWMRWGCFVFLLHASCFMLLLRVYLVFFNVKWINLNDANKWKNYIDTNHQNNESFFIKHKSTLGNIHYIYKYFIVACLLSSAIPVCLLPVGFFVASLCDAVIFLPIVFILFLLWLKTPLFDDEFIIHQEIRNILIMFALIMVHYMIFIVSGLIVGDIFMQWYITHIVTILMIGCMALFATMYPMYKYERMRQRQQSQYENINEFSLNSVSSGHLTVDNNKFVLRSMSSRSQRNCDILNNIQVAITDVIKTEIGFDTFMIHLSKEWSMENLLAVVEMTQYKLRVLQITAIQPDGEDEKKENVRTSSLLNLPKKLKDSFKITHSHSPCGSVSKSCESDEDAVIAVSADHDSANLDDNDQYLESKEAIIELPKSLPFSTIVYGNNYKNKEKILLMDKRMECKRIIQSLLEKYILIGAGMEVNLSSRVRQHVINKYEDIDGLNDKQLFCIFDKCIRSLLKLMQDSYLRFKSTAQFIHYEKKIKKRIIEESVELPENSQ